jgi:acetyl-CoA acetyltransferase
MREVAIVSSAQRQESAISRESEGEFVTPLINAARDAAGLTQADIGFTCSGSSDYLAGQAFSFVMTIDGVGPVPPISESHVEMDGAWALYEAWVKLQIGEIDAALVYSYGKSSPGSLRDVLATQLDPYYLAPLWPDSHSVAALQARFMLESGAVTRAQLDAISARSLANAASNPHAVRQESAGSEMVADPLTVSDCAASADGGVAVILAADDLARRLSDRPAFIRGIDHRVDPHQLGVRDLGRAPSAALAAAKAGVGDDKIDLAELHAPYTTQEHLLVSELGLAETTEIGPSGGALAGNTMMAAGLMRIVEAAQRISSGEADRAVAHATSGPLLQQNLVCVLEGE